MNYLPHQQRVVDEQAGLDVNIAKLVLFRDTATFRSLPEAEVHRLIGQLVAMRLYSSILGERIAAFGEAK